MFTSSKQPVQLLALILLIGRQGVSSSSFYLPSRLRSESLPANNQAATTTTTVVDPGEFLDSTPSTNQDNPKRYQLREDLDLEGYIVKQPLEQRRLISLNQLLDSLSSSIPTAAPPPIYRTGRTDSSASSGRLRLASPGVGNLYITRQQQQFPLQQLKFQNQLPLRVVKPELDFLQIDKSGIPSGVASSRYSQPVAIGIEWTPEQQSSPPVNTRRSQLSSQGSIKSSNSTPRRQGQAEVALHTPMHTRSVNEYDWKRVENTRWNNLRGMWGKRATTTMGGNENSATYHLSQAPETTDRLLDGSQQESRATQTMLDQLNVSADDQQYLKSM